MRKWWIFWPLYAGLMGFALGASFFFGLYGRNVTEGSIVTQQEQQAASEPAKSKKEETDEALAFYTLWLMAFTGILALATIGLGGATVLVYATGEKQFKFAIRSGIRQSRDMQNSIAVGKRSAAAAEEASKASMKTADGIIKAELPIVAIAKLELHRGPGITGQIMGGDVAAETNLVIDFKNRGRTAAELRAITVQWEVRQNLPAHPVYKFESKHPFAPGIYMEPGKPLPTGNARFYVCLEVDDLHAVEEETKFLWVYGFVSYADFMGEPHESRFCAKWVRYSPQPDGALKPVGFVYDSETPESYTQKT